MRRKAILLAMASAASLTGHAALAQGQGPQDSARPVATNAAGPQTVAEVVVTAEKRNRSVQKTPIAISVVTANDLQREHIFDPSQLQYVVPSLQEQSTNSQVGATNYSIRGVGTSIYGPAVESSVAVVIDDVALARPSMGVVQFFDLDHVEVLRGPQGMLFGKNASAGLINIVTAQPRLDQFETLAHLSYGNMDSGSGGNEVVAQVAQNIPVSSTSAARVSAFMTRQDGYGTNAGRSDDLGATEYGAKLKYFWAPTSELKLYLEADYARERGPGGSVMFRRYDTPGGFAAAEDAAARIIASPTNNKMASNASTANWFALGGAQAKVVYALPDGASLTSVTAFRAYRDQSLLDSDLWPTSLFDLNTQSRRQQQFSEELRLTSRSGGRAEYQLGLYYLDLRAFGSDELGANLEPIFPAPPPGFIANLGDTQSSSLRNQSYAAFGQARVSATDRLRFVLGGRLTRDVIVGDGVISTTGFAVPLSPAGALSGGATENNFSYRAGAEFDLAPRVMAYLTYARGYKSPTFGGPTGVAPIKAEIPVDLEVGLKSTLFDRRLVLNLALYDQTFKNYQAQAYDPSVLHFVTENAGDLKSRGFEGDFTALPFKYLKLTGGWAYNDATYKNYAGVACYFNEPTGASGNNVCLPNGTTNVTGDQLAFAPKWTASLDAVYERPVASALNGFVEANYYHRSSVNFTAAPDPQTRVGSYGLLGGSFGVETDNGRWRLSVWGRNLLDKRVPTFITEDPLAPIVGDSAKRGDYLQQFGETSFRTIGVSLDVRY